MIKGKQIRLALISTVPYFLVSQLGDQIRYLTKNGCHITVITSPGDELNQLSDINNLDVIRLNIPRKPEPLNDLLALIRLTLLFIRLPFDVVHSTTPKAGLLVAIAARIAFISTRLHTFTGQAWVTQSGLLRSFMRWSDKVVLFLSTRCYADSASQAQFLEDEGIASAGQVHVSGSGSLAGVDTQRFDRQNLDPAEIEHIRHSLKLTDKNFVMMFLGRLTNDKGVRESLDAFDEISGKYPDARLLLVGPVDDVSGERIVERAQKIENIEIVGQQQRPEYYLAVSDVLLLPSYREGFGTVVLEAAAMGLPAIGTDIVGLRDAIVNNETGLLVPPRDAKKLAEVMEQLLLDSELRHRLGEKARQRSIDEFDTVKVSQRRLKEYREFLDLTA